MMTAWLRRVGWITVGMMLVGVAPARAETVELVTYYPAPAVAAATETPPTKPHSFALQLTPGCIRLEHR